MAGTVEASAILSTIEIGFSLAKTLYASVGEYKNARDDITRLATDVEATLTQAQELEALLASTSTSAAQVLNKRGLKLERKCTTDSQRIVLRLLKLLTKAGVSERQAHNITPDDIDVSKFRRAAWVFLKKDVLEARRELDSIKLSALLARSCVEAKSAANADEIAAAASRIVGLQRSRRLAQDRVGTQATRETSHPKDPGNMNLNGLINTVLATREGMALIGVSGSATSNQPAVPGTAQATSHERPPPPVEA